MTTGLLFLSLTSQSVVVAQELRSVSLELVLAADASSSVNEQEYQLQVEGYANAFRDVEVIAAINALGPRGLAVTYVEWNGRNWQVQSVGWTEVFDGETSRSFADAIERGAKNQKASGTAIGEAVLYSAELLENNQFSGDRMVIDLSADDIYNAGTAPSYARDYVAKRGITVNGLAVEPSGRLEQYFRDNVIGGFGSFVINANSFDDFSAAIKMKLLRELGASQSVQIAPQCSHNGCLQIADASE